MPHSLLYGKVAIDTVVLAALGSDGGFSCLLSLCYFRSPQYGCLFWDLAWVCVYTLS